MKNNYLSLFVAVILIPISLWITTIDHPRMKSMTMIVTVVCILVDIYVGYLIYKEKKIER